MNESSNHPAGEGTTFLRVVLVLAATIVVLAGVRLGAPVLNPIFFAVVLTLLFSPVYSWLLRRGLPAPLALLVMLVLLAAIFVGFSLILGGSIGRFTERVGFYTAQLDGQVDGLDALLERLGLSDVDLREVVEPSALTDALGAILSGISAFLSNLFLILMIMLFLLGEGPAMMDRLRASAGTDNPQVASLTAVGRGVVRQFGLRAVVNLVTGAGVTVLLFLLGVDFPLLWGILTFFLSFVPYIGLVLAVTPAVVLALAESGVTRAVLVIAGVVVINILAENVLSPMMMGRGLNVSPTIVFLSFVFWAWLLGGPGAFLALPITLFLAVMFGTFPGTRWLASLIGAGGTAPGAVPRKRNPIESRDRRRARGDSERRTGAAWYRVRPRTLALSEGGRTRGPNRRERAACTMGRRDVPTVRRCGLGRPTRDAAPVRSRPQGRLEGRRSVPRPPRPRGLPPGERDDLLRPRGGLERVGLLVLQRHHADHRRLRGPRPRHGGREDLHHGLHLRGPGRHRRVHQRPGEAHLRQTAETGGRR